jgi:hypothetical protein
MKLHSVIASAAKQSSPALAKGAPSSTSAALAKGAPPSIVQLDCFADARNDGDKYRARFMRRGWRVGVMDKQ